MVRRTCDICRLWQVASVPLFAVLQPPANFLVHILLVISFLYKRHDAETSMSTGLPQHRPLGPPSGPSLVRLMSVRPDRPRRLSQVFSEQAADGSGSREGALRPLRDQLRGGERGGGGGGQRGGERRVLAAAAAAGRRQPSAARSRPPGHARRGRPGALAQAEAEEGGAQGLGDAGAAVRAAYPTSLGR